MKRLPLLVTMLASAVVLAGCSGAGGAASDATGEPSAADPITINVAETAGMPSAFLSYGVDQGFFADEGLDLIVDTGAGGAAAIPGVISGSTQFAGSNTVSVLLAKSRGLPVKIVAPGTFATKTAGADFSAVLVSGSSSIQTAADLSGTTIAVNTLENIGDVTIQTALEAVKVDVSDISFVELGFPSMLAALDAGQIDAAWVIEPFVTTGLASGARAILWPYVESLPGLMVGSYVTSETYASENPLVIEAFRLGVSTTAESISSDPDAFRSALTELASISETAAASLVLPVWNADVDPDSLTFIEEQMFKYDVTDTRVDVSTMLLD